MKETYQHIHDGGIGFYCQPRALIEVWGREAVQFLDGMITNDVKTLDDGAEMLAAFPNAQGRLLAVVRVLRRGDRYLIETEEATREKLFANLFRFTYAGDFFVEDLSERFRSFELFGLSSTPSGSATPGFTSGRVPVTFVPLTDAEEFASHLRDLGAVALEDGAYQVLRVEAGLLKYNVDIDETTIVPELGIDEMISYKKGCYIGQEIIARIYFRGHVAKRLTGLIVEGEGVPAAGSELMDLDDKNAGRITSAVFSPKIGSIIALGSVRYAHLEPGTNLRIGDRGVTVTPLPFAAR